MLYEAKMWDLNVGEKRRMDVMEIKYLSSICGVTVSHSIRNEEI